MARYYLEPTLWIDCMQGKSKILDELLEKQSLIIYSDILEEELLMKFLREELSYKLSLIPFDNLIKVKMTEVQFLTAEKIAKRANLSFSEVIHAVIARDNDATLIVKENLFIKALGIVQVEEAEE